MITGKWADMSKFKGPILRGLAGRAPYFHNGIAATLTDVIKFYDTQFHIGLDAPSSSTWRTSWRRCRSAGSVVTSPPGARAGATRGGLFRGYCVGPAAAPRPCTMAPAPAKAPGVTVQVKVICLAWLSLANVA